jgi:hydrophobic/amphiphilic exporter-1 (mainly G- bacteria), HAE1 family
MNISEIFIKRPIATTLLMLALVIFGIAGYLQLPVNDLPNVDYPTITVQARLPGANPDTMASAVALPLEKQLSTIPGVEQMTSNSGQGNTNVTLQFDLSRNIDGAAQDVQAAITSVRMPRDMPNPPAWRKANPADQAVLSLLLSSSTLPLSTVDEYAQANIAQRLSMISGVAQVDVAGSQKYAVRVRVDPYQLAARQIGLNEVQDTVASGNVNAPTGTIWGTQQTLALQTTGQLFSAADYRPLIIAYRNGAPVRVGDVAQVVDSVENERNSSWFNGERNIQVSIVRQPGSNTVEVVDRIKDVLPAIQENLPPGISMIVRFDRSASIRASLNDVKFTLLLALCLVVMVIFLFLRSFSATLIPSLALPLSIVGTFAVMYLAGFSINNFTLMALTLAVGFVVDDAIVMLENIVRHIEKGMGVMEAALKVSQEIGFTILSITLSLAAVFLPVLFLGGILGRLLHEFAVTIISAILVSGFVSLTLTPMVCRLFLQPHQEAKHGAVFNFFERIQDWVTHTAYAGSLRFVLRHKVVTMLASALLLYGTVQLYNAVPKGFVPSDDDGGITGGVEVIEGTGFPILAEKVQQVATIAQNHPDVAYVAANSGTGNRGNIQIQLKPAEERPPIADVISDLRRKLSVVPGVNISLQSRPALRIGGFAGRAAYQITLQSANTDQLYISANQLVDKLKTLPGIANASADVQLANPQIKVQIDRDKASALGISASQVEDALGSAYGQRQVSTIMAANNQYAVILELAPEYQRNPEAISSLYIRSRSGGLVQLGSVATLTKTLGPVSVTHLGQLPSVNLSFDVAAGGSIGEAVDSVTHAAEEVLPDSVAYSFQGTAKAFQSSIAGLGMLLLMAVMVIYIVLGILYESFIHPITILSGLPSAAFGALLALWLFHTAAQKGYISRELDMELNLYGFVGVIMLIGIVKKNAIMMIDFALEAQRHDGKDPAEAIYQGCVVRFRPIMMTTAAALMGILPIAIGHGAGGASRRPLGVAVAGGLMFSQIVTLYLTPVLYIYMEKFRSLVGRLLPARRRATQEPVPTSHGPVAGGGPVQSPIARSTSSDLSDLSPSGRH